MLPPQAPPALSSSANQAAVDTLQRLADTQAWLAAQQHVLQAATADADVAPDDRLDAFWSAPVEHTAGLAPIPRREAFALRLSDTAKDIASLRANDGTLAGDALDLVREVANHPRGPLPSHLRAFELLAGDAAYAGALVLADDRRPDRAMLFTASSGWETFASIDELLREFERRLRERLAAGGELPGAAMDDIMTGLDGVLVTSRRIDADPFHVMAQRIVARFAERARAARQDAAGATDVDRPRLALHDLVDVHAMLAERDSRLADALQRERLANQPADVRFEWQESLDAYLGAAKKLALEWQDADVAQDMDFAVFAREALIAAMLARGHDVDPDHVLLRISDVPTSSKEKVSTLVHGRSWHAMSLSAFAMRNVGAASTEVVMPTYPDDTTRTDLTASTIKQLVRELDLPSLYARHLDAAFADTAHGRRRRQLEIDLLRARLRFDAAETRLGYADANRPRGFLPDAGQTGFRWAKAVLDDAARAGGANVAVRQLSYRGAPLAGVLLIASRSANDTRVVMYTPDAPDRVAFREFGSRAQATRDFLRNPTFEPYLAERLPLAYSAPDGNGIRRFTVSWASRTSQWIFGGGDCAFCTLLEEPFTEIDIPGTAIDALHDTAVALAKRNAHDLARSTAEADRESAARLVGHVLSIFTGASALIADAGRSAVLSVPRTAQAAWRFYDSVKTGDGTQAFLHFTDGYVSALEVAGLQALPRMLSGALVRAGAGSGALVRSGRPVGSPSTLFEERFIARGVAAPRGATAGEPFVIGGQHYIQHGGKSYPVSFDAAIDGWRLTRPGTLDARFTGPAVEYAGNGQWQYGRVGLLGGAPPLPKSHGRLFHFRHVSRWERSRSRFTSDLEAMSPQELVDFQADIYTRLGQADGNRVFAALGRRRVAGVPAPRITPFEQGQWDMALVQVSARRRARNAPSSPSSGAAVADPRPGTSAQASATTAQTPPLLEGFERIPAAELPEEAFYYASARELAEDASTFFVTLPERRITLGVQGVPLLTSAPASPLSSLDPVAMPFMPRPVTHAGGSLGVASGAWVRLRLRDAHRAATEFGSPPSFEAFRSTTPGNPAIVLRRPGPPARPGSAEAALGFFDHYSIHFAPR